MCSNSFYADNGHLKREIHKDNIRKDETIPLINLGNIS